MPPIMLDSEVVHVAGDCSKLEGRRAVAGTTLAGPSRARARQPGAGRDDGIQPTMPGRVRFAACVVVDGCGEQSGGCAERATVTADSASLRPVSKAVIPVSRSPQAMLRPEEGRWTAKLIMTSGANSRFGLISTRPCSVANMTQPPSPTDGRVPLPPPPPDQLRDRLRRRLRSVGAFTGLRHWLLVRGLLFGVVFAALFVANGLVIGWKTSYDVAVGITSPGDKMVSTPALAWVLSVAGWLAAPAVFGAVAGIVVDRAIEDRRRQPISAVLTKSGAPHG